jgi:hypothetical protein
MRRIGVVPIDFRKEGGKIVAVDPALYSRVMQYCGENLAEIPNLTELAKVWSAVEFGEHEEIIDVHGLTGYRMVPDVPLFRATGASAKRVTSMLYDRINGHFADAGWRGHGVFLYLNSKETPEQRCPAWDESLNDVGAEPANRLLVMVR